LSIARPRRFYPYFISELFIFQRLSLQLPLRTLAAAGARVFHVQQFS
jgi:hypothetical protein